MLTSDDLLISLDVVSLFARVPLKPISELLTPLFPEATVKLFEYILQSTYFTYNGCFYEQVEGVAMGSPLSSVIADFSMEIF